MDPFLVTFGSRVIGSGSNRRPKSGQSRHFSDHLGQRVFYTSDQSPQSRRHVARSSAKSDHYGSKWRSVLTELTPFKTSILDDIFVFLDHIYEWRLLKKAFEKGSPRGSFKWRLMRSWGRFKSVQFPFVNGVFQGDTWMIFGTAVGYASPILRIYS